MQAQLTSIVTSFLLVALLPGVGRAATLYTLNTRSVSGIPVAGTLLIVDQETGATTTALDNLTAGSWSGLASSPTDSSVLYALHNPRAPVFEDPQFSRLVRLDLNAGTETLFPFFDQAVLGFPDVFSTAVAISPERPDVAVVIGNDAKKIPPTHFIWNVDLTNGEVLEAPTPLVNSGRIEAMTFGLDGTTLYGTNSEGQLVTIDQQTAEVSLVGDPGLTNFLTGIAFRPEDDRLFAIDAQKSDRLVTLNADGSFLAEVGPLGISGPEGLAFAGGAALPLDCDANGEVNALDLDCANAAGITDMLLDELGLLPGDFDGNGEVNFADFVILAGNFSKPLGKYTEGDINNSGEVNFADFIILAGNFGKTSVLAAVPEPSSGLLLILAAVTCIRLTRSRRLGRD